MSYVCALALAAYYRSIDTGTKILKPTRIKTTNQTKKTRFYRNAI